MPKFLRHVYFGLLVALPPVLFFSYYPLISLGSNTTMNFELSLPLIWLVLFNLISLAIVVTRCSIKDTIRGVKTFFKGIHLAKRPWSDQSKKRIALLVVLFFVLYLSLSIFWSSNSLRAFLTSGIVWLLFLAVLAIIFLTPQLNPPSRLKFRILGAFFLSTAIICLFCFWQALMDSCGVSRDSTLLCAGCTYQAFGFPHPNGFAIEPQFMGNLLLAPTLLALYLLCFDKTTKNGTKTEHPASQGTHAKPEHATERFSQTFPHLRKSSVKFLLVILTILFSTTLFFTFSRGAIYSFAIGLVALLIFAIHRHHFRPCLIIIPVVSFVIALSFQGIFAQFGPTSETFSSAVAKSLHQLSLGVIDLRSTSDTETSPSSQVTTTPVEPIFDGYVEVSTTYRLRLSQLALTTWLAAPGHPELWVGYDCYIPDSPCNGSRLFTPTSILFGVGLGAAGTAISAAAPTEFTPKEIVQNQFLSLLLETGLLGVVLLLVLCYLIFRPGNHAIWHHPALPLLFSLVLAYLISLNFFAGLPNALHIYLLPPLFYTIFLLKSQKSTKAVQN